MINSINFQGALSNTTDIKQGLKRAKRFNVAHSRGNLITKTMTSIGLNPAEYSIKNKRGYTTLFDKEGKIAARISPKGKCGINYAYVLPKNSDVSPERYALADGEIIFKFSTLSGAKQFAKNFTEAVKYNKTL